VVAAGLFYELGHVLNLPVDMFKIGKIASIVRLVIWVALCLGPILSLKAHPASNVMPDVGLVVLPEPGLRLTSRNQADFELGKINSLDNPQVEHRFTVRNEGETPLAITNFETTCHCTTATVETIADQPVLPDTSVYYLLPGQAMVVKLAVNLARQPSGPLSHGVALRASGHECAVARLYVTGEMEVALAVSSSALDFGQMKRGETQAQPLTIAIDRRLLSGDVPPELVVQSAAESVVKASDFLRIVLRTDGSAQRERTYEVIVQPKQTGKFSARLVFAPITPADYRGTIPYDRAMEIFRGMQIDVRAEVTAK